MDCICMLLKKMSGSFHQVKLQRCLHLVQDVKTLCKGKYSVRRDDFHFLRVWLIQNLNII